MTTPEEIEEIHRICRSNLRSCIQLKTARDPLIAARLDSGVRGNDVTADYWMVGTSVAAYAD